MESLIDKLNPDEWEEQCPADKCQEEYLEYHVLRNHKVINSTTYRYMIAVEDGEPINVELFDCKTNTDPLKNIGMVEIRLDEEMKQITGIDLNGDIVVKRCKGQKTK